MRMRAALGAFLVVASVGASMTAASGIARAQTPTATATATATGTTVPLAPCPTGTVTVTAPAAAAPSTVAVTITPALANLKGATAADPASHHLHFFVDTPAATAGTVVPTGNPQIIHGASLTQDLGTLAAGSHTVVVVVGQVDHKACDLRGQVTFTTAAAAVAPPKSGSGGLLGRTTDAASSALAQAALLFATTLVVGGAAVAMRRR